MTTNHLNEQSEVRLEPCPFCPHGIGFIRNESGRYNGVVWVECDWPSHAVRLVAGEDATPPCGARTAEYQTEQEAARVWNSRASVAAPSVSAPVDTGAHVIEECERRADVVVEAAIAWHESGQEGQADDWFEASERLTVAIEELLALRDVPADMPRRWCSVHQREEFKYESLEHELHTSNAVPVNPEFVKWKCPKCGWRKAQSVACERCHAWCENVTTSPESVSAEECSCGTEKDAGGCPNGH